MKKLLVKIINRITLKVYDLVSSETINSFFKGNYLVQKIPYYKSLYAACRMAEIEFLYFNELNDQIHFRTKDGLRVITDQGFWIFIEVLCDKRYIFYQDFIQGDYIVFDVGANRGYASLFFALDDRCKQVYSFEPCLHSYAFMKSNIGLNPDQGSKISPFNFGLSDKAEKPLFQTHPKHDWINTENNQFLESYIDLKRKSELVSEKVELRKASDAFDDIFNKEPHLQKLHKFLKIDIEGAEYKVLAELKDSNILKIFSIIYGECHMGIEGILSIVADDFELKHLAKQPVDGLYSFLSINRTAFN